MALAPGSPAGNGVEDQPGGGMPMLIGGAGGAAGPGGSPSPGGAGPLGTPMSTPQASDGLKAAARMNVTLAIDTLTKALPDLGAMSEEGKAIRDALKALTNIFGKSESKSRELIPAEIMQLLSGLPQSNPGPTAQAMSAKPKIPSAGGGPVPM